MKICFPMEGSYWSNERLEISFAHQGLSLINWNLLLRKEDPMPLHKSTPTAFRRAWLINLFHPWLKNFILFAEIEIVRRDSENGRGTWTWKFSGRKFLLISHSQFLFLRSDPLPISYVIDVVVCTYFSGENLLKLSISAPEFSHLIRYGKVSDAATREERQWQRWREN